MKSTLTPRVMILAASIAGLIACNASKKVETEQQDLGQAQQEVVKDQAELNREQAQERAELEQKQARDIQRDQGATAPTPRVNDTTMAARNDRGDMAENAQERAEDRTEMARDHQEERADLHKDNAEKIRDEQKDVMEAKKDANEQRADIIKDAREDLEDLDQRAAKLREKLTGADDAKERTQASTALSGFPTKRQAVERDIEALNSVSEANLNRAKDKVQKQLSSLDKVLDRAEGAL